MSKSASVSKLIVKAAELANSINAALNEREMNSSSRNRVAGAAYSVSLDHFSSIVILMDHERNASAMALLRVQHEAFIFGHWVETCASDRALEDLIGRNQKPKIDTMLKAIKASGFSGETEILNRAFEANKRFYDGHAHSDMIPVSRMVGDGWIGDNFSSDELHDALISAGCFCLLTGLGIARLMDDQEFSEKLLLRSKQWGPDG